MKFIFVFFFLLLVQGKASYAGVEALDFFKRGIETHDRLFDFLITHPCEIGMNKNCQKPLSARDMEILKNSLRNLEEWRKLAFNGFVPMSTLVVNLPSEVHIGEKFSVTVSSGKMGIVLAENDPESLDFVEKAREGTATILLLYDSFFRLTDILAKAKKLRLILQLDMPEDEPILQRTYSIAMDKNLWESTSASVGFLNEIQRLGIQRREDLFTQYFVRSFSFKTISERNMDFRVKEVLFLESQMRESRFFEGMSAIGSVLSRLFGNSAGMIQMRDGKLKAMSLDSEAMKKIKSEMKPLDLLLEKTPFRLTDQFIPGYFGHVAIWLGTPEELSLFTVEWNGHKIPLLSHPDVVPHLGKLSEGRFIVEALRLPGVTMNTLEHFMDIDDFVVLESPPRSDEEKAKIILRAFQQVGKAYDFNFDVETEREIVCSELVYRVFTDEQWPTDRSLGRFTISPDHVAWKAVNSSYTPVLMYLSGKKVEMNLKNELERVLTLPGGLFPKTDHQPQ